MSNIIFIAPSPTTVYQSAVSVAVCILSIQ
jgi:hypothetical protein